MTPYCSAVRLGLISDIHGNLLALDAVLGELNEAGIDRLVYLTFGVVDGSISIGVPIHISVEFSIDITI